MHSQLYQDLLLAVRKLFHECRLVHADLSEYNVLYHSGTLYIIDVSQSVEHNHPHAFEFLRKDLGNIEEFFSRRGVACLGLRRAFDFVTRERQTLLDKDAPDGLNISHPVDNAAKKDSAERSVLEEWMSHAAEAGDEQMGMDADGNFGAATDDAAAARAHEDAVFMKSYIPRNLNEVFDPERDVDVIGRGEGAQLIYSNTIGLVHLAAGVSSASASATTPSNAKQASPAALGDAEEALQVLTISGAPDEDKGPDLAITTSVAEGADSDVDVDADSSSQSSTSESGEDVSGDKSAASRAPRGHRHEDRDAKRERKRAVKEEAREKRKTKMKKADKKRKIKATRYS